jgi:sensor histidine kinase YesM
MIDLTFQDKFKETVISFLRETWKTALWLVVIGLGLTFLIAWDKPWNNVFFWKVASFAVLMWQLLWLGNAYLSNWLDSKISWHKDPLLRFGVGIAAMMVYTVTSVYALIYFYRIVFRIDVGNDMGGMLYSTVTITIIISMFMTSRLFLFNWRQASIDAEKAKQESIKAQYESLKSQVNPHFLFNSLNALTNLVYQDQDQAAKFIKQLSAVYRYVLDSRDKEVVSINDELKFLESYLFLQQIRFGDKLNVQMDIPQAEGRVAPLALQMLLENAIKHNVISEDDPLTIHIYRQAADLIIENTVKRKQILAEDSSGLGLKNIKRRYEYLTDRKVLVEETATKFKVTLPILSAS